MKMICGKYSLFMIRSFCHDVRHGFAAPYYIFKASFTNMV